MIWLTIGMVVLGALPKALQIVESLFDGIPDSSADKKKMATEILKTVVIAATSITGPELDKLLIQTSKMIEPLIDLFCTIMFPHEEEVIG